MVSLKDLAEIEAVERACRSEGSLWERGSVHRDGSATELSGHRGHRPPRSALYFAVRQRTDSRADEPKGMTTMRVGQVTKQLNPEGIELDAVPEDRPPRRAPSRSILVRSWKCVPAERTRVVIFSLLASVGAQAETVALVLIALMASSLAAGREEVAVDVFGAHFSMPSAMAGLAVLGSVGLAVAISWVLAVMTSRRWAKIETLQRERLFVRLMAAEWEDQASVRSSRMQGRMRLTDARGQVFGGLVAWCRSVTSILIFLVVAIGISLSTAVAAVVLGGLLSAVVLPLRRHAATLSTIAAGIEVELTDEVVEAIDQGPDVQVFDAWPVLGQRFDERSSRLEATRARAGILAAILPVVYQFGALALIAGVLLVATKLGGTSLAVGETAAAALLLLRSVQYGQAVQGALHKLAQHLPYAERLDTELGSVPQPHRTGVRELEGIDIIELSGVSYTYPGASAPALREVDLSLSPGAILGIAGPSGSGKSTLAQVLLRLRWPTQGRMLVNAVDSADFSQESWRRLVSHVPQSPRLLHGSLADNVAYLDATIPADAITTALEAVGLDVLAEQLPGGVDSHLGPSSRTLSGGQVQRIGIARALARGAQLVVLDEPTSALDVDSEELVTTALAALARRPRTIVIVIAHRPSTLRLCDKVLILDAGRVVDSGLTRDVARRNPFFAKVLSTKHSAPMGSEGEDLP
jgi:ATP-binding cassette, subfamily B, bacterial